MASGPPKQRGIYSEILTTENTEALKYASTVGPQAANVIKKNEVQAMPRAVKLSAAPKDNGKSNGSGAISEASAKQLGRSYFKQPNTKKKREGVAEVEPKVMEPYVPIPGRPPRKVVIDRLKKQYASFDIEDLLKELGVDFRNPNKGQEGWLPLEPFDDEEYDCRTKQDWIDQGKDPQTGKQLPVPAKALWEDQDGQHYWRRVLLHGYNERTEKFEGVWDGTKEVCKLTRINILFDAEDPRIFANRMADAHQKRRYADSLIRYNYFIDNMPTQEIPDLDAEQIGRIKEMVQNNKSLRKQIDLNPKINEVNLDFARTMNKIIFDKHMEEKNGDLIASNLQLPPKDPPPPVPHFAMVSIPPHDFPEQFSNFCFNTLYVKEEVIHAMVDIKAECNEVLNQEIYNTKLKTMRLEDFKQIQSGSISQRAYYLKETWVNRLKEIIKSYFSGVGKGWFNLNETSKETYEFGKLKKFLTVVKFQMQDTLLFLTKRSVKGFVSSLLRYIPYETKVTDALNVKNFFKSIEEADYSAGDVVQGKVDEMLKEPPPLFLIDLMLKSGTKLPVYNMDPEDIVTAIQTIFDNGIKALQEIPELEPKILPHLFKTQAKSYLKAAVRPPEKPAEPDKNNKSALPDENTWVWDAYETISKHLTHSIQPLIAYAETYVKYENVNALNPEEYVANLDEGDNAMTEEEIKGDIHYHMQQEKKILGEIPEQVVVSIFEVNCKEIRNQLSGKHAEIVKLEIDLIGARARAKNAEISNKFREMDNHIRHAPKDIEDLHETKEYMANAPNDIMKLKIEINKVMDIYNILDDFNFRLSQEDIKKKWELFGAPKDTFELIDRQSQYLEKEKEKFMQAMVGNQADFVEELNDLENLVSTFSQYQDMNQHEEIANIVKSVNTRLKKAQEDARLFNSRELLIGLEQTDYSQLNQMNKEFSYYSNLWLQTDNWFKSHESWLNDPWEQLDAPKLEDTVEVCNKTMTQVMRYFRDKELPPILQIAETMKKKVEAFNPYVPLAVSLRKKGMKDRHWEQITEKTGIVVKPDEDFTLQKVLDLGLAEHTDICVDVGERAEKEYNIETSLNKMYQEWESIDFRLPQFKKTNTCFVVGFDDAMQILDEHIVMVQAMQFSPFNKPFKDEIQDWNHKMMLVSDTIEEWIKCQQAWMYLQPIFDSQDIMRQLPAETKRFKSVDSTWKHIINNTKQVPNVLKTCSKEGLLEKFQEANKNLELVTKGLYDYLETKRSIFARFYFLSNDELLEILSQTKEVENVRPHLKKVFENMANLTFMPDKKITEMFSGEGECVKFVKPVDPVDKGVEFWMGDVERMMQTSVREVLLNSVQDYKVTKRTEWVFRHPGQCVLNGSQVHWTAQVEDNLNRAGNEGAKEYLDFCNKQLLETVQLVRQRLTKLQTISLNALIVIDVHAKDVMDKLWRSQVEDIHAFEWIMQLRYYWENDDCRVKCVVTDFPYGYEYLGNTMRLVITPLTDKCYMTLMGALKLNLGGNPAGPAGTGKTESTKDLAKALAKQCVVFNCSEGMDYKMVGKFFKGLASAGAWCCFDEFNRINIEVLSVIAQQLHTLFGAKASGDTEIEFEESQIKVKPTFSVFVTMNPGYAGRTELPDNLKAHFRPVAMMVPDYALIAEIMLYSFGFTIARDLARKMVATFKLSSEQLSSQDHYDYGMRAVRSVINAAGLLKSADPDMDESQLLLRALRDVNVPKFLKEDLPLFENIISDLFPTTKRPEIEYGNLLTKLKEAHEFYNYQSEEIFITKNIQLYDTIQVRHGLMIVGPTGGAKTATYRALSKAYNLLKDEENFSKVHCHVLNPKSITMGQLYGMMDPQTSEWMDGVLAKIIQECAKDQSPDRHWVMFDGPVDALWIENMNTVLDDNKKLCLNSGQIITLTDRMTMMFEVEDLAVASPATVSRCGMVYMEPDSLGLPPLLKSWYNTLPPSFKLRKSITPALHKLVDSYLFAMIDFTKRNCKETVVTPYNNVMASFFKLCDSYFSDYYDTELKKITPPEIEELQNQLESLVLFSLIWSCGAPIDFVGRTTFDKYFREATKDAKLPLPPEDSVYDYCFNRTEKRWVKWLETIPDFKPDSRASFAEIVVPTNDSVRNRYLLKLLISNQKHVMSPGPTGTGKTVNVMGLMQSDMPEEYTVIPITFSAQTSANQTQDMLDSKFEKRRKGFYGPPPGKKYVIFVDDLNMPKKEQYGAQPPIELLRQWMDHHGWYDRKSKQKPFWIIEDIIIVAAMGEPGGGRSHITNRITRHFNVIAYTQLEAVSIKKIFLTILQHFVSRFAEPIRNMVETLTDAQLRVYNNVHKTLLPMPAKSHYLFNMRDFAKVFQGLCSAYSKTTQQTEDMLRLWVHENTRVFGDRLINMEDSSLLKGLLDEEITKTFKIKLNDVYTSERVIFGDYMMGLDVDPRYYAPVPDMKDFLAKVEDYLEQYNDSVRNPMKLVMFLDACEHVSRISRVLRQPQGHALLLGVGGSGRQSLSRLGSFIATYKLTNIEVIKGYSMINWREDIKKILMVAGVDNKQITFLFVDTQIINEQMLEDINNILNSGDVPNLYKNQDLDAIYSATKNDCLRKGLPPTKMNMFNAYLFRIKSNIHLIIAMSPLGEIFRTRLRMFPSLVNCCTIDWFHEWPGEALLGVARGAIGEADLKLGENMENCVQMFKIMHQSVEEISKKYLQELRRHNYVTPTSYLELLNLYKRILTEQRQSVLKQKNRLEGGLKVLAGAQTEVAKLQTELDQKQPVLEQTKKDVEETKKVLQVEYEDAEKERKTVAQEESSATQQANEIQVLKKNADADLAQALPALESAVKALEKLKVEDFYEMRAAQKPTKTVVNVFEIVCIMMNVQPIKQRDPKKMEFDPNGYWEASKLNLLKDPKALLRSLVKYDKDHIPDKTIIKVKPKTEAEEFSKEKVEAASQALVAVRLWVLAMVKYHEVLKIVEPKREEVKKMNEELTAAMAFLNEKRAKLQEVEERIDELERKYREKVELENSLTQQIEDCNKKLERAGKLIKGLESENDRWSLTVKTLTHRYSLLIGDCLLAAGMVSYAGPFISQYRSMLEEQWNKEISAKKISHTEDVSMRNVLGDDVLIRIWNVAGLPNDNLSIENGIIMFKSRRWSLMIDPQNQANKFVKNLGRDQEEQGIDVFKQSDPNMLKMLELAIQFGKWVLIENVGQELDPALEPILLQQKQKSGSSFIIRLGDKSIPYSENFRFFMTTTLPNPHYAPETSVKVTILNFAITPVGLEEQMLNQMVQQEMPELQEKKNFIVTQNAKAAKDLRDIEEKILQSLTKNDDIAMILEEDELINILATSKKTAEEINQRVAESKIMEKEIDHTRESFRPVAFRASLLFFCINDLSLIDPMYQYSLQWFAKLFSAAIDNSAPSNVVDQRIASVNNTFTFSLYQNVCRSLFETHKLLFSFLLTTKIQFGDEKIDLAEWRFFLAGASGDVDIIDNPLDWLGDMEWKEMYKNLWSMSQLPTYKNFDKFFVENHRKFKKIFDSNDPQNEPLPGEWNTKLNSFQKMVILKAVRADKISKSIQNYVTEHMGSDYIKPPPFNIASSFKDSSVTTPLIFVLSPGTDPVADFLKFSEEMSMTKSMNTISLGQGQDKKAEKMIDEGSQRGGWVLLQNCHLAISWMPRLEAIVENLNDSNHRDFRLWLTSMPCPQFPVSTLQNSVKMTLEPPKGLRFNLERTFINIDNKELNDCTKPEVYKKLTFSFAFFHAIIQDRRKFGAIGWNIAYEFTNEDLMVCRKQLKMFLDEYDEIPFKVLNYLGSEINYGGRVTDDKDERLIETILRKYVCPDALKQGYKFSISGKYYIPDAEDQEDFLAYIRELPIDPEPEAFGMHQNAEITTNQDETRRILEAVLSIQPRTSSSGGKTREDTIMELAKFIEDKTPKAFVLENVQKKFPIMYEESMNTVLVQEVIRYNKLLNAMSESLTLLQKALRGFVVMSEELELTANSIFDNQVPSKWASVGFLSLKPLASWVEDLNRRIDFLQNWISRGSSPLTYWISGFFFPQAFLTGTLQNFARKHVIAIDRLSFDNIIYDQVSYKDIKEPIEDGVYVYGLYLEGARWNDQKHILDDSKPKELYSEMPMIWFLPKKDREKPASIYDCPVYKVLSRHGTLSTTGHSTNFVLFMELPSKEEQPEWIKAGVAAFLALRY